MKVVKIVKRYRPMYDTVYNERYTIDKISSSVFPPTPCLTIVSGVNFLVLSVNLIPVSLSLTCLFMLLPHLLTVLTQHSHRPEVPLSFTPGSRPTFSSNLSHHRLPSVLRTDSTAFDWTVSSEQLGFYFHFLH